jgi:hypothetical protein
MVFSFIYKILSSRIANFAQAGSPDPASWAGSGDPLGASTPKGETVKMLPVHAPTVTQSQAGQNGQMTGLLPVYMTRVL